MSQTKPKKTVIEANVEGALSVTKFHFVFIIDLSGSMKGDKMERARNTLKSLVKKIQPGSTFSIISFWWIAKIHTRLDGINRYNGIFEKQA